MKIETIDVEATIENIRKLLKNDPGVSPALEGTIELLLTLVILMMNQLGLNSQNSSKPPSTDPNRKKKKKKTGLKSLKMPMGSGIRHRSLKGSIVRYNMASE